MGLDELLVASERLAQVLADLGDLLGVADAGEVRAVVEVYRGPSLRRRSHFGLPARILNQALRTAKIPVEPVGRSRLAEETHRDGGVAPLFIRRLVGEVRLSASPTFAPAHEPLYSPGQASSARERVISTSGNSRPAPPRLHFSLAPEPSRLLRARERIRDYLTLNGADHTAINDVVLAIEEAFTNAIRHSGSSEDIDVRLGVEGKALRAVVADKGRGFAPESFDASRVPDPLQDHGRGLYLISKLCDELHLYCEGGVTVEMVKGQLAGINEPAAAPGTGLTDHEGDYWSLRERLLRDEMDEAFASLDWEYRFTYANKAAFRFFAMSPDGYGRSFWEVFPATREMAVGRAIRRAMELGVSAIEEYVSPMKGRWVECRVYPAGSGVSLYLRDIDERKRKELERDNLFAALRESQIKLETALAAITDGFYTLDRTWHVTYLNESAAAVFPGGKAALGADFWQLFPEAAGSDFETNKRAAMEQGEFRTFESYYPPFDTWFEERDYPGGGGITVLFSDISERKRAEAERERLIETTSLLLDATTTTTSWTTLDHLLESLGELLARSASHSRVVLELWDEERQEIEVAFAQGRQAVPRERFAFDEISDGAKQAIRTRKTVVVDYAHTGRSGSLGQYLDDHAFVLSLAVPIVYRERLVGLVMVDEPGQARPFAPEEIEVMEAIAAQAAASIEHARLISAATAEHEQLRTVLETMTEGLVISDADARVIHMNPEALRLHGLDGVDQVRRGLADWSEPEPFAVDGRPLPLEDSALARVTRGETFKDLEYEVRNKTTGMAWIGSFSGAPIRDETGRVLLTVLTIRDITERKRVEAERQRLLEDSQAQAQELQAQGEKMQAQAEELLSQRDTIARELESTSLLLEAAETSAKATTLSDVLDRLVRVALRLSGHSRATISSWHEELRRVEVVHSEGESPLPTGFTIALDDMSAAARTAVTEGKTSTHRLRRAGARATRARRATDLALRAPRPYVRPGPTYRLSGRG